jgi:hypothetical protein
MPHELHVIKAGDFIRSGPQGELDFETSRQILKALAEALLTRGIDKAVLDLRKTQMNPPASYTQLYHLARAFQEAGYCPRHRLAVLISPDRYDKAEFFAICASGRGWNTYAFDDFEDAFDWLTDEERIETSNAV